MTQAISPLGVGIIGCGAISKAYITACRKFPVLDLRACADLDPVRAVAKAAEFQIPVGTTVEALLADPAIDLVINLTVPQAHAPVALAALAAGKHVFGEKPFALTLAEGQAMVAAAAKAGLRLGCAPDTVLGCGVQTARKILDDGLIGKVIGGSAFMLCGGHETWHPSPEFYYQKGGGPLFDMGPYYLHALITLLGPVRRVTSITAVTHATRTITSQPKRGTVVTVEVPTHVVSVLQFASGALINLTVSFDVGGGHTMPNIELYGTAGSMQVPDPNGANGPIKVARRGLHDWTEYQRTHPYREGTRGVGVADMAQAIRSGRPHRADERIAVHALEIMEAIHVASERGTHVDLTTSCERPAAMPVNLPEGTLD